MPSANQRAPTSLSVQASAGKLSPVSTRAVPAGRRRGHRGVGERRALRRDAGVDDADDDAATRARGAAELLPQPARQSEQFGLRAADAADPAALGGSHGGLLDRLELEEALAHDPAHAVGGAQRADLVAVELRREAVEGRAVLGRRLDARHGGGDHPRLAAAQLALVGAGVRAAAVQPPAGRGRGGRVEPGDAAAIAGQRRSVELDDPLVGDGLARRAGAAAWVGRGQLRREAGVHRAARALRLGGRAGLGRRRRDGGRGERRDERERRAHRRAGRVACGHGADPFGGLRGGQGLGRPRISAAKEPDLQRVGALPLALGAALRTG